MSATDKLIEELRRRADTMNGSLPVGAGDGSTYACGYYGLIDRKLDRALLDTITSLKEENERLKAEAQKEAFRRCIEYAQNQDRAWVPKSLWGNIANDMAKFAALALAPRPSLTEGDRP